VKPELTGHLWEKKNGHTYLSIINPNVFPAIFGYLYTVETELIN
jgi:hypothetical protein